MALYRPLPEQERFHRSLATERVVLGSNRGGKTLAAAVEIAAALTGQAVIGRDNTPIFNGYPKADGIAFATGINGDHIAKTLYRKLFKKGAYKIIRDAVTRRWRAFDPTSPADIARKSECRASNPLIPKRFIKEIAWEAKGRELPKVVKMRNGWEIWFFSAAANPPQGDAIDITWLDEEIGEGHYTELRFRLIDKNGRLVWSATPQNGMEELYALHTKAEEQAGTDDPNVEEFKLKLSENVHIDERAKQKAGEAVLTDDEYRVRIDGDFIYESFRVYGEFSPDLHGLCLDGGIPDNWTRYMAIDPGHTVGAVLFCAVPPPWFEIDGVPVGDILVVYDEVYQKKATAARVAAAVHKKVLGGREQVIERWWIDNRAARQTQIASGRRVGEQYTEEFKKNGLKCRRTSSAFSAGNDNPDDGINAVRGLLEIARNGLPRLFVLKRKSVTGHWVTCCPELLAEFKKYHRQRIKGVIQDAAVKANDHLMDCLRYVVMGNPRYVEPPLEARADAYAAKAMSDLQRRFGGGSPLSGPITFG